MTLADRFCVATMRAAWLLAEALPLEQASGLGAAILRRAGPRIRKHRMLVGNLRIAFPELGTAGIEALARDCWAQFGRVIAEFPHFSTLMAASSGGRSSPVEVVDPHGALRQAAGGRPAFLMSGHFANWELLAGVTAQAGVPLAVVHAARADPGIEALVEKHRRALGCAFIEQGESVHAMLRHIRRGSSIGVLVDQRYDKGEAVPFFGQPAFAPMAPAMLAARFGLPFIPVRPERVAPCQFRVTFEEPLAPDHGLRHPRAIAHDLMTRLYTRFEAWIRERPDEWLCIKRRWPHPVEPEATDRLSAPTPLAAKRRARPIITVGAGQAARRRAS